MKRRQYTRILIEGDEGLLDKLTQEIEENYEIRIVRKPEMGLVLHKVKDAVSGQPFFAGEILVTSCSVKLGSAAGFGICLGENPDKAYGLAVVDAAFNAQLVETKAWPLQLLEEERKIKAHHRQEHEQIMRTRVHFETQGEYLHRVQ